MEDGLLPQLLRDVLSRARQAHVAANPDTVGLASPEQGTAADRVLAGGTRAGRYRVGLSLWEVLGGDCRDLLAVSPAKGGASEGRVRLPNLPGAALDFTCVQVRGVRVGGAAAAAAELHASPLPARRCQRRGMCWPHSTSRCDAAAIGATRARSSPWRCPTGPICSPGSRCMTRSARGWPRGTLWTLLGHR